MKSVITTMLLTVWVVAAAQIGAKVKAASDLEGSWTNSDFGYAMTLELLTGGKGSFDGETMTWAVTGQQIRMNWGDIAETYTWQLNGQQLTLTGGDLDGPLTFVRAGASSTSSAPFVTKASTDTGLAGVWTGNGEELEFRTDGSMFYNGVELTYVTSGTELTLRTENGSAIFQYQLQGNQLTLSGGNTSLHYSRKGTSNSTTASSTTTAGHIAMEMVGKWCYVNVTSNSSGGWSTDECFTLYENGTYEYYSENSGSATGYNSYGTQIYAGGTSGSNSDRGTWRVQGNQLIAQSQTQGQVIYLFQKQNHPKNNDPMIVIDGRAFVTQYQKEPWR